MQRNKAWFFRNNPLLEGVTRERIDELEQRTETHNLRKRTVIWMNGDPADRVYWVRSGIVKLTKVSEEGRELTLQFLTRNDIFGEVAVFSPGNHDTMAEAYEDCVLYSMAKEDFQKLLLAQPELALGLTRIISERRKRLENRVSGLLFKTAHARLAALFLELSEDFGVRDARGVIVNLRLTHKEMASLIGATRETVSFAILDLRKDNYILTESKRVIILDEDRLKELVDGK